MVFFYISVYFVVLDFKSIKMLLCFLLLLLLCFYVIFYFVLFYFFSYCLSWLSTLYAMASGGFISFRIYKSKGKYKMYSYILVTVCTRYVLSYLRSLALKFFPCSTLLFRRWCHRIFSLNINSNNILSCLAALYVLLLLLLLSQRKLALLPYTTDNLLVYYLNMYISYGALTTIFHTWGSTQ